jgi:hypothetical protein
MPQIAVLIQNSKCKIEWWCHPQLLVISAKAEIPPVTIGTS